MSDVHQQPRYTMIIQWSDEDASYVASLPEWGPYVKAHGATYDEAARHAREVLEMLLDGESAPPVPKLFRYPGADVMKLPDDAVGTGANGDKGAARRSA